MERFLSSLSLYLCIVFCFVIIGLRTQPGRRRCVLLLLFLSSCFALVLLLLFFCSWHCCFLFTHELCLHVLNKCNCRAAELPSVIFSVLKSHCHCQGLNTLIFGPILSSAALLQHSDEWYSSRSVCVLTCMPLSFSWSSLYGLHTHKPHKTCLTCWQYSFVLFAVLRFPWITN